MREAVTVMAIIVLLQIPADSFFYIFSLIGTFCGFIFLALCIGDRLFMRPKEGFRIHPEYPEIIPEDDELENLDGEREERKIDY